MGYTVIEQTDTEIDAPALAKDTGWSASGNTATHEICNAGSIYLNSPISSGQSYEISYSITEISGGTGLRAYAGTAPGVLRTTAGFFKETITATGSTPRFRFYSDSAVTVTIFNIRNTLQSTALKQQNTITFSEKTNKWESFLTYNPDYAFSLFTNLYVFKMGLSYIFRQGSASRNKFFGTQYKTYINPVFNSQPVDLKSFQSIYIRANQLFVTSTDGIVTSLGQVSELIATDFLDEVLTDGVTSVNIYTKEGVYRAGFMRDKNIDIINGDSLKGNYISIDLVCDSANPLKLLSMEVKSVPSFIG